MELQKLTSVLEAGWSELDLAAFALQHFKKPFYAMKPKDLIAIINSALYGDFFARHFLKQRAARASAHIPPPLI
ncbi:hypothetical protein [Bradyrhizobium sp. 6(2017)]|uniref:hypothetical protein n=1 Tax=Bradyrhizobium sp. 6(2017) TaxID=1197460 RepID=UPI0013E19D83|nr:hypothetical protein [Bradyrhizobium sp. 6(2017)]QIG96573.1 hypothetical protein G6P99_32005 [Bradyrhizobium sp. 6(2017)]